MLKFNFCSLVVLAIISLSISCKNIDTTDYYHLPTYTESGAINVVVEIPAGTNHKIEFKADKGVFENDLEDGKTRVINFLPYPGNYGFIPSTYMDPDLGGDGDALDVLVIAESQPTKSVMEVNPIAVLLLRDNGALDSKIIAIPTRVEQQIIQANNFQDFMITHDAAKRLVETWFLNYKGQGEMQFIAWKDEQYAQQEIEKWLVK